MKKYIFIILAVALFGLCKKKEEPVDCSGDYCLGKRVATLSSSEKLLVPDVYKVIRYVSDNNDTIKLIFRDTMTFSSVYQRGCNCPEQSTDFSGENRMIIYKFLNEDLALHYNVGTTYTSGIALDLYVSDTNTVIHKQFKATDPCSQFQVYDYPNKKNDFDSLLINNKWYFNVINSFDYVGLCPTGKVRDAFYSKGVGFIQFTYKGTVYRRN